MTIFFYDLLTDEFTDLAPRGRGPGDIMFTKEMQFHDNRAYIAMQGFRISVFDCQSEKCEYDHTIETEFNTYSLAPENVDQNIIHQLNSDGDIKRSYSPVYKQKHPMIREAMNSGGKVRAFPEFDSVVLVHNFFPYIYLYNSEANSVEKYRVQDFYIGYYDEFENPNGSVRGRARHNDNTNTFHSTKIDDEWMLLQMREGRNLYWVDRTLHGDQWYSYYVFNVDSRELYKIGESEKKDVGENRAIRATEHGLVINEQGNLSWVSL